MSQSSRIAEVKIPNIRRGLKTGDLFSIGYGDLGSSIYYALGITAFHALGATPLALLLAGLVFAFSALSYAELTAMYPESGGSATFARAAFNDLIALIAGWALLLDYIVTIAISSFSIAPYLAVFFPELKEVSIHISVTIAIIISLFFLNYFGARTSTRTSLFLAVLAIATQVIIILIGAFVLLNLPQVIHQLRLNVPDVTWSPTTREFLKGTAIAMVAYTGIESIAQLGAEAKNPGKTVPRSIFLNIIALLFLYLGIAFVAFSALSPITLGTTYVNDPISGIVNSFPIVGPWMSKWVGLLAAILLFVASNAGLIGASRLTFNMSSNYLIPHFFFKLHKKYRTPTVALGFFAFLAILVVILCRGQLSLLADLYNFGLLIAFTLTSLSLIVLRIKAPHAKRPYRIPFNLSFKGKKIPVSAIIAALSAFSVWILILVDKPYGRYLGFSWMVIGIAVFFVYRRRMGIQTRGTLEIQRVSIPEAQAKGFKHVLVAFQKPSDFDTIVMACSLAKRHKAELTAVYVMEVPFTLPVDSPLAKRESIAQSLIDRAEAIARKEGVTVHTEIARGRDVTETLSQIAEDGNFDLLILGIPGRDLDPPARKSVNAISRLLKHPPCPIWICYQKPK